MDPDAALEVCLSAADTVQTGTQEEVLAAAEELAEHFLALDQWMRSGGFAPTYWSLGKTHDR